MCDTQRSCVESNVKRCDSCKELQKEIDAQRVVLEATQKCCDRLKNEIRVVKIVAYGGPRTFEKQIAELRRKGVKIE